MQKCKQDTGIHKKNRSTVWTDPDRSESMEREEKYRLFFSFNSFCVVAAKATVPYHSCARESLSLIGRADRGVLGTTKRLRGMYSGVPTYALRRIAGVTAVALYLCRSSVYRIQGVGWIHSPNCVLIGIQFSLCISKVVVFLTITLARAIATSATYSR